MALLLSVVALIAGAGWAWEARSLFGSLLFFAGQGLWFAYARSALWGHLHSSAVPMERYKVLRFVPWFIDFAAVALAVVALEPVAGFGTIDSNWALIAVAAVVAVAILFWRYRKLGVDEAWRWAVVFVWLVITMACLNYALDFWPVRSREILTYRECPKPGDGVDRENSKLDGCRLFLPLGERSLDSQVEILHRTGGLGFAWREMRRI